MTWILLFVHVIPRGMSVVAAEVKRSEPLADCNSTYPPRLMCTPRHTYSTTTSPTVHEHERKTASISIRRVGGWLALACGCCGRAAICDAGWWFW
eukprot:scaffold61219_cov21-Cyclotella_meneghiniana.AAC.1